jgi:hypothetical protein
MFARRACALDEIWFQDCRPVNLPEDLGGIKSTAFAMVWLFLMLSVNAVIMICARNCRISFTLIV